MRATLDWSYDLLTEIQQMVLRRVSVFSGDFTLRAADFVISDDPDVRNHIVDHVAELVTKSLILAEMGDAEPRLRLLETTRAYALAKLIESGEFDAMAPRYAAYVKEGRSAPRARSKRMNAPEELENHSTVCAPCA